ncbi:NTF2- export protein 2 [Mortierella sp. GBA35]|nr:NTF2- export protein 2 [Mortierella sp. AD031]KAF9100699.1 NTF2- export protein 2 [Mortierella sp. GBA35]KAG0218296.1 NTF2- export protein 2 [Mortierella sp. NVP41]
MADALKVQVDRSSQGADAFVAAYYNLFDTQRPVLNRVYRDSSAILWNGNAYSGIGPFSEFYNKLASSEHSVSSYDCHPLPNAVDPSTQGSILVNVSGTVKYGNEPATRHFSQSFVLSPDPTANGDFFVWSDCFRFV